MREIDEPRTRRAVLGAALGAAAATVASALGRAAPVRANNGDAVTVGGSFDGTNPTSITNSNGDGIVARNTSAAASGLFAHATAGSGPTYGVFARSDSTAGTGVAGVDYATDGSTRGVYGESRSADGAGVYGTNLATSGNPKGVYGVSTAQHGSGVYGHNSAGSDAAGVLGNTTFGYGVLGKATSGIGVSAYATSGLALFVNGRAAFRRSGRASIPAGKTYVDVTPDGGLASSANVLATLQRKRSGVFVAAARINYPSAGKARIYLNKVASTTSSTPVAWFVLDSILG